MKKVTGEKVQKKRDTEKVTGKSAKELINIELVIKKVLKIEVVTKSVFSVF